uniref:CSON009686 protein n=1 Tax=Culicoides sonorensis TaxID=179676 RepID=A0A336M642_CULSO
MKLVVPAAVLSIVVFVWDTFIHVVAGKNLKKQNQLVQKIAVFCLNNCDKHRQIILSICYDNLCVI